MGFEEVENMETVRVAWYIFLIRYPQVMWAATTSQIERHLGENPQDNVD